MQHDFRRQQQGRNAVHGLRRGDERRHLQGFHDEACEGLAMQGVPDSGQLASPPCVGCGEEAPSDGKSPESGRRGAPVGKSTPLARS